MEPHVGRRQAVGGRCLCQRIAHHMAEIVVRQQRGELGLALTLRGCHQSPDLLSGRDPQRPHARLRLRRIVGERQHRDIGRSCNRRDGGRLRRGERAQDQTGARRRSRLRAAAAAPSGVPPVSFASSGGPPCASSASCAALQHGLDQDRRAGPITAAGSRPAGRPARNQWAVLLTMGPARHHRHHRGCRRIHSRSRPRRTLRAPVAEKDHECPTKHAPHLLYLAGGTVRPAGWSCAGFHADRQPGRLDDPRARDTLRAAD